MKIEGARKIPYGRQSISAEDIQSVVNVLTSDWLTQGPSVERFEEAVAEHSGAKYSVAVSNATAALHIACLSIGLGPGDRLWTSPNTFVASANCARYCGAQVDFVDIDPATYNMSVSALATKLASAEKVGLLPKVVVPVHFAGQSCDMEAIKVLSDRYGFFVIEDASHAIGGRYQNEPIGNCRFSDMTVFSFHPVKIVTTGEGGVVVTNQETIRNRLVRLRSHGITRDAAMMEGAPQGPWDYQQIELGYNYRLTDIQAALGRSQLLRVNEFVARRHTLVQSYELQLQALPLTRPYQSAEAYSAFHLYVIRLKPEAPLTRFELFEKLRLAGIGVNVHYIPVHLQPYYKKLGFKCGDFPEAEKYYSEAITLPLYYDLSGEDQQYIIDTLSTLLTR